MKVKVRIALAIDEKGHWEACGWAPLVATDEGAMMDFSHLNGVRRFWVEAEIEVPAVEVVAGTLIPVPEEAK